MRLIYLLFFTLIVSGVFAQNKLVNDYISTYGEIATTEMLRTGIPASIKLAQGMLESSYGQSELAAGSNNHFGIKCHNTWTGERFYKYDDEFCEEGKKKESCFRVYSQPQESFYDHSEILKAKRYAFLFEYDSKDYVSWANGLLKAGYATDPQYANKLIEMIEKHALYRFDESTADYQDLIAELPVKEKSAKKPNEALVAESQAAKIESDDHSIFDVFRKKKKTDKKSGNKDTEKEKEAVAFVDSARRNKNKVSQNDAFNDDSEYLFDEPLTPKSK